MDNRLTVLELDSTRATFTYDATSQIVSEARGGTMAYARSYLWDPMGNRLQQWDSGVLTSGTFNKANQQTLITPATGLPTTQSFDAAGNMILESTGAALVTSTWSPENRLVNYVDSKGDSVQSLYSDDGLRRQRTLNSVTANLAYDEKVLLLETNTTGNLKARYTNYPKTWGGIVSQELNGTSSMFGFDSQGSARILVSVAGLVTDIKSWKAFGEPIQPGSGTLTPYGYVAIAAYYLELTDLFNAWHRWIKSSSGRFRSKDKLGFAGGEWNQMIYVGNEPIRRRDPAGLQTLIGITPPPLSLNCDRDGGEAAKVVKNLCDCVRQWPASVWKEIDECVTTMAVAGNQWCPDVDSSMSKCMFKACTPGCWQMSCTWQDECRRYFFGHYVPCTDCADCYAVGGECSGTPENGGPCLVSHICMSKIHDTGCGCNVKSPPVDPVWCAVGHELSHACGWPHYDFNKPDYFCNDAIAACMYRHCGNK